MAPDLQVVPVTDDGGTLLDGELLSRAEPVHRQLRPQLPADYAGRMRVVFSAGAKMAVVCRSGQVLCVAVWRLIENTHEGRRLYVDDLVTDEVNRSVGAGNLMIDWLERKARKLDCDVLALDSGVQRERAHRFYFREGMGISSFSFRKLLK